MAGMNSGEYMRTPYPRQASLEGTGEDMLEMQNMLDVDRATLERTSGGMMSGNAMMVTSPMSRAQSVVNNDGSVLTKYSKSMGLREIFETPAGEVTVSEGEVILIPEDANMNAAEGLVLPRSPSLLETSMIRNSMSPTDSKVVISNGSNMLGGSNMVSGSNVAMGHSSEKLELPLSMKAKMTLSAPISKPITSVPMMSELKRKERRKCQLRFVNTVHTHSVSLFVRFDKVVVCLPPFENTEYVWLDVEDESELEEEDRNGTEVEVRCAESDVSLGKGYLDFSDGKAYTVVISSSNESLTLLSIEDKTEQLFPQEVCVRFINATRIDNDYLCLNLDNGSCIPLNTSQETHSCGSLSLSEQGKTTIMFSVRSEVLNVDLQEKVPFHVRNGECYDILLAQHEDRYMLLGYRSNKGVVMNY